MNLQEKRYEQLIKEAIAILLKVKDNSDCIWTYYETPEQMRTDIDKYISALEKNSLLLLDETYMHFLPTSGYQEHSIANDWTTEYHKLAERFDNYMKSLKL
jgi:hypothetical protein